MAAQMMNKRAAASTCRIAAAAVPAVRPRTLACRALNQQKSAPAAYLDSIGLPTDEGYFGFKPFSEVWVGRWAMIGFVSSIYGEAVSGGKGTLAQLGLMTPLEPSLPLLVVLSVLALGGTAAGTASTLLRIKNKQMSMKEMNRYRSFFGLTNEDDYKAAAMQMKRKGDFTSPGMDLAAVAATKAAGMPADAFLAGNDAAAAAAAAVEMKAAAPAAAVATAVADAPAAAQPAAAPAPAPAQPDIESQLFHNSELRYARSIELSNGRAAMLGFLAAVLVEAGTGKGIIFQLIMWFKMSGLLGEASGF